MGKFSVSLLELRHPFLMPLHTHAPGSWAFRLTQGLTLSTRCAQAFNSNWITTLALLVLQPAMENCGTSQLSTLTGFPA